MKISRRSVLHISGLAAAALALTGCSAAGSAALGGKLPGLLKGLTKKGETAASSEAASDMAVMKIRVTGNCSKLTFHISRYIPNCISLSS